MEIEADIIPVGGAPYETWRYTGPLGEVEFEAAPAVFGGRPVLRNGRPVIAISIASLRWAGEGEGRTVTEGEREAIVDELRRLYRARGSSFDLAWPSGQVEDESGAVRSGFRSALPIAEHSDGWSVVDLFLSPQVPDAADAPSTIRYADASGTIEIPRDILVEGHVRFSALHLDGMRWVGAKVGAPVGDDIRERVRQRVQLVSDRWDLGYQLR
jgi:hypothetical protein